MMVMTDYFNLMQGWVVGDDGKLNLNSSTSMNGDNPTPDEVEAMSRVPQLKVYQHARTMLSTKKMVKAEIGEDIIEDMIKDKRKGIGNDATIEELKNVIRDMDDGSEKDELIQLLRKMRNCQSDDEEDGPIQA